MIIINGRCELFMSFCEIQITKVRLSQKNLVIIQFILILNQKLTLLHLHQPVDTSRPSLLSDAFPGKLRSLQHPLYQRHQSHSVQF